MAARQEGITITYTDLGIRSTEGDVANRITLNPTDISGRIKILSEQPIGINILTHEYTSTTPASNQPFRISLDDDLTRIGRPPRRRVPVPNPVSLVRELDRSERLSIKDIPLNWTYLQNNAHDIGRFFGRILGKPDLAHLVSNHEVPAEWSAFIPMVASNVAHTRDRSISFRRPTFKDAVRFKPAAGIARKLLGESEMGERFESIEVAKAEARINETSGVILRIAETASGIENPRRLFHEEMDKLYRYATSRYVLLNDQALGPNTKDADIRLEYLLRHLLGSSDTERMPDGLREQFKLTPLVRDLNVLPKSTQSSTSLRVAAPEILSGIYNFLYSNGSEGYFPPNINEPLAKFSGEWAYFRRQLTEKFKHKKLASMERKTTDMLQHIFNILPESGPQFADSIYRIAEGICKSKRDGYDDDSIARNLLQA